MSPPPLPPTGAGTDPRRRAGAADYIAIARPDHWVKHVFMVPGIVLARLHLAAAPADLVLPLLSGFASAALIASANYVLNEWLDARYDRFHPTKSQRPAVARALSPALVYAEYAVLALAGLALAPQVSPLFFFTALLFLLSGLIYNVPPLRTKEKVYLDVLSESLNNPIRLTLGWAMVDGTTLPPSSLLLAFWMGGAFLMAIKRFAEYRSVLAASGREALTRYRRSFRFYTEDSLLLSAFLYSQLAAFFLAVFLIKYRVEYLLSLPLFALLFASYLRVGLKRESAAQTPERLFRERALMIVAALLVLALAVLTVVDLPAIERLASPHYIRLSPG